MLRFGWLSPAATLVALAFLSACGLFERGPGERDSSVAGLQPSVTGPRDVPGGDPKRGRLTLQSGYGCGACHVIPGVPGAIGKVGPPLTDWAERAFIAGNLPNTPENLVRWVRYPQAVEPGTAMPDLGVSEPDARDIAAYLYTLR